MKFATLKAFGAAHTQHDTVRPLGFLGQVLGSPNRLTQERADAESALGAEGWVRPWQSDLDRSAPTLEIQSLRIRMAEELLEARIRRRSIVLRAVTVVVVVLGLWLVAQAGTQPQIYGGNPNMVAKP